MSVPPAADIALEYLQTGEGVPEGGKTGKLSSRDGSLDKRLHLPCANPDCKKGGFLFRRDLEAAVKKGETSLELNVACAGYIGPIRSERGTAPACQNRLKLTLQIVYGKPSPPADPAPEGG